MRGFPERPRRRRRMVYNRTFERLPASRARRSRVRGVAPTRVSAATKPYWFRFCQRRDLFFPRPRDEAPSLTASLLSLPPFLAGRGRLQIVAANKMSRPNMDDADIAQFKTGPNDTGSSSLQIALLTKRIENLTAHLMVNKKDYATQRGLRMLLGQRSRLSKYLKKDDPASYEKTMEALGLKMK